MDIAHPGIHFSGRFVALVHPGLPLYDGRVDPLPFLLFGGFICIAFLFLCSCSFLGGGSLTFIIGNALVELGGLGRFSLTSFRLRIVLLPLHRARRCIAATAVSLLLAKIFGSS